MGRQLTCPGRATHWLIVLTVVPCLRAVAAGPTNHLQDAVESHMATVLKVSGRLRVPQLRFAPRSDTLLSSAEPTVRRLAHVLVSVPGTYLIEAHVVPTRDATADQALTDQRASAVKSRLIHHGVPPKRLLAMGFGGTKPLSQAVDDDPSPSERIEITKIQ
ncbi:MAG: OmpA family protein [Gemmatimonadota bacterium]|nr:OmpA family protein [Gemmatimonadota bacterium]